MAIARSRCRQILMDGYVSRRCRFKPWKDGYCKKHHPEEVQKRKDARMARYEEERKRSAPYQLAKLKKEHERLLERCNRLEAENMMLKKRLEGK